MAFKWASKNLGNEIDSDICSRRLACAVCWNEQILTLSRRMFF